MRNKQYHMQPTDTEGLTTIKDIIEQYGTYVQRREDGLLALMLARDAVFGQNVMSQCTPVGMRKKHALPQWELYKIKTAIFQHHPECWILLTSFEKIWKRCLVSIQQDYYV